LKETIFLNKELESLFLSGDPFLLAEDIQGEVFRQTANRITKEFSFEGNKYFIKLHYGVGWKEIFKNLIKLRAPTLGAFPEWKALKKLKSLGIDCPEPVGFYSKGINPSNIRSFIVTRSLINTISIEEALNKGKFQDLDFLTKKRFIEKVALISRNLHNNGINHRDYYLCHFHVDSNLDVEKEIYLIDLHRAQLRTFVPTRWASKDVGGLFHSAMGFKLTERDFYRFIKTYFQCSLKEALGAHSKFIRASKDRAFRMFMKPVLREIDISFKDTHKDTSGYLGRKEDSLRWVAKKKYLSKGLEEIISQIDSYMEKGEIIKDEEGHKIIRINLKEDIFVIKKYKIKGSWHYLRKLFSQTRAFVAWKASHWFNAAGIRTINIVAVIEKYNFLSTTDSYLISLNQPEERLDKVDLNKQQGYLIENRLSSFFKRLEWIGFNHGDAKSANFFFGNNNLIVSDLDVSKRRYFQFIQKNKLSKDKKRILKSFEDNLKIKNSLLRRL